MPHLYRKATPLYLKEEEREQLDLYADIVGVSRQKLLEAIIASCLDDLDTMDRIGFLVSDVRLQDQLAMYKRLSEPEKSLIRQAINQN